MKVVQHMTIKTKTIRVGSSNSLPNCVIPIPICLAPPSLGKDTTENQIMCSFATYRCKSQTNISMDDSHWHGPWYTNNLQLKIDPYSLRSRCNV